MAAKAFTVAMRDYFGYLPLTSEEESQKMTPLMKFAKELKALSKDEKQFFADGLRKLGVDCADPSEPIAATVSA
jgi:hypothetical protein